MSEDPIKHLLKLNRILVEVGELESTYLQVYVRFVSLTPNQQEKYHQRAVVFLQSKGQDFDTLDEWLTGTPNWKRVEILQELYGIIDEVESEGA